MLDFWTHNWQATFISKFFVHWLWIITRSLKRLIKGWQNVGLIIWGILQSSFFYYMPCNAFYAPIIQSRYNWLSANKSKLPWVTWTYFHYWVLVNILHVTYLLCTCISINIKVTSISSQGSCRSGSVHLFAYSAIFSQILLLSLILPRHGISWLNTPIVSNSRAKTLTWVINNQANLIE